MVKRRVLMISIVFIMIIVLLYSLYYKANQSYKEDKKRYYMPKITFIQEFIKEEKLWIKKNQGDDGQIYMNSIGSDKNAHDVNPYFACLAAQGLLVGEVTGRDMKSVKSYIDWHIDRFIHEDGEISHYHLTDEGLTISGAPDSVDSYIAVFISLMSKYIKEGGTIELNKYQKVIELAISKLEELTVDGLTKVSFEYPVIYLMDNIEVQAAYRDLLSTTDNDILKEYLEEIINNNKISIMTKLWNEKQQRYEIGLSSNGDIIKGEDKKELYPDAIAQIYNIAFDVYPNGEENARELYSNFNENIIWRRMEFRGENSFFWSELSYISALMSDIESTEIYLDTYREKISASRKYPFHIATAGWILKTASALEKAYEDNMNKSLIEDFIQKIL